MLFHFQFSEWQWVPIHPRGTISEPGKPGEFTAAEKSDNGDPSPCLCWQCGLTETVRIRSPRYITWDSICLLWLCHIIKIVSMWKPTHIWSLPVHLLWQCGVHLLLMHISINYDLRHRKPLGMLYSMYTSVGTLLNTKNIDFWEWMFLDSGK